MEKLGETDSDYVTIKYCPNGDTAWVRRYNGLANGNDGGCAIAVDDSGNVYVVGTSWGGVGGSDYATIKYCPNGDTAWMRRYNGEDNGTDSASAIAVDGSGNVYVTGVSWASETDSDYVTIKYCPNGDTAWVRRYDGGQGNRDDGASDIALDGSGNVYVTGFSNTASGTDFATIKYDSLGNQVWVTKYAAGAGSKPNAMVLDLSENILVVGTIGLFITIKYYPSGDTAWVRRYNGPGNSTDIARAVATDGSGNVYVVGRSYGTGTDYDYATIKYVQFLRGDANRDGVIDLGDVVYLINYLYKNGPIPVPILQVGDVDCDGVVDLGDVLYLINYLYKGGPPPCS